MTIRYPLCILSVLSLGWSSDARSAPDDRGVESVVVTAGALPGTTLDPDKIPSNLQTITSTDLNRFGAASTLDTLERGTAGVSVANAQENPFQPSVFYRGFEASPLAGDAQGLAVYANGVRLNQPFGDTLNWDLIPDIAIDSLTLEGSNPVFGLNALGGSVAIRMKNGFTYAGAQAVGLFGAFDRRQGSFQYGIGSENQGFYVAGTDLSEAGWRQHSPSRLAQLFADLGWRGRRGEVHLSVSGADDALTGNGSSPVELLAVSRAAVFTFPDQTKNTHGLGNLYGTLRLSDALSLQGNLYLSTLHQRSFNADASDAKPCEAPSGLLCLDDGSIVTDKSGNPIPGFLSGGPYGQLNTTETDTTGYGGAFQFAYDAPVLGKPNHFLGGLAIDQGRSNFAAQSELGGLSPQRGFVASGMLIDQADGSIAPVKLTSRNSYYGGY